MSKETGRLQIKLGWDLGQFNSGLGSIKGGLKGLKDRFKTDLGSIVASGATLGAGAFGLKKLIDGAAAQDEAFSALRETTGTTAAGFAALKNDIYEVNRALGLKDSKEAAQRLYDIKNASGLVGKELKQLTLQSGFLAGRFKELGSEKATKAQVEMLRSFKGTTVKEVGDALAFLAGVDGDVNGKMSEAVLQFSGQLRDTGLNLNQSTAVIGAALAQAWDPAKALDMLKDVKTKLLSEDQGAGKALDLLGLGRLPQLLQKGELNVAQALGRIGEKFKGLEQTQALSLGRVLFGDKFAEVGVSTTLGMITAMQTSPKLAGGLDQVAHDLGGRFSWQWNKALSSLDNGLSRTLDEVGKSLLPVVKQLGKLADQAAQFSKDYPNLTKAIALGVPGFTLLTGGVWALSTALTVLGGPVGLTLGAVALLGAGLYLLEQKTGAVSKTWDLFADGMWSGFTELIGPTLTEIGAELSTLWEGLQTIGGGIAWVFEKLTGNSLTLKSVFRGLGKIIGGTLDMFVLEPIKRWLEMFNQIGRTWTTLAAMFKEGFSLDGLKAFAVEAAKLLWDVLLAVVSSLPGGSVLGKMLGKSAPALLAGLAQAGGFAATTTFAGINYGLDKQDQPQRPDQAPAPLMASGQGQGERWTDPNGQALLAGTKTGWGQPQQVFNITVHSQSRDVAEDIRKLALAGG